MSKGCRKKNAELEGGYGPGKGKWSMSRKDFVYPLFRKRTSGEMKR